MQIIFLDVDETITSRRSMFAKGYFSGKKGLKEEDFIDPVTVGMINRLIEVGTDTKVVINSGWSFYPKEKVMKAFRNAGFTGDFHKDWCTNSSGFRGDGIDEWLVRNPDVTSYVILDDLTRYYFDQPLVHVDSANGMMIQDVYQAAEYLYGDMNPWREELKHYMHCHPSVRHPSQPLRPDGRYRQEQHEPGNDPT